jgi:hypothetical protein
MSLVIEQSEFLHDVIKLIQFATAAGFVVTGGELWRSPEQQAIYFKTGRSKTLDSNHLKRLAIDLNFFKDGVLCYDATALGVVGRYWESLNPKNRWGGHFRSLKDLPHFERNPGGRA